MNTSGQNPTWVPRSRKINRTRTDPYNCTECQDQQQATHHVTFSDNGDVHETALCRDHAHIAASAAIHGDFVEGIKIERLEK